MKIFTVILKVVWMNLKVEGTNQKGLMRKILMMKMDKLEVDMETLECLINMERNIVVRMKVNLILGVKNPECAKLKILDWSEFKAEGKVEKNEAEVDQNNEKNEEEGSQLWKALQVLNHTESLDRDYQGFVFTYYIPLLF